MRVGRMVMMVVPVAVIVSMCAVVVVLLRRVFTDIVEPADAGAEIVAEQAIGDIGAGCAGALALDMMVMAFLNGMPHLALKSQHLAHGICRGRSSSR